MFSETTRKRLQQLIPRLASDHDGEVVVAVRAIQRVMANEGRDLHDLARAAVTEPTIVYQTVYRERAPTPGSSAEPSEWLRKATECVAAVGSLTPREAEFVQDMAVRLRHQRAPTEKQAAWLDAIYHRIRRQRNAG